jgi:hypothetical protein
MLVGIVLEEREGKVDDSGERASPIDAEATEHVESVW